MGLVIRGFLGYLCRCRQLLLQGLLLLFAVRQLLLQNDELIPPARLFCAVRTWSLGAWPPAGLATPRPHSDACAASRCPRAFFFHVVHLSLQRATIGLGLAASAAFFFKSAI